MSKESICHINIGDSLEDDNIKRIISNISKSGIIDQLNIIAEDDFEINTTGFKYGNINNYENLTDLLHNIINIKSSGDIYFEANTAFTELRNDNIVFNSFEGTLTLNLTQSTYRGIPNLSQLGIIKILKGSKIGHGSKNSKYDYRIRIDLTKFEVIPPELDYIIKTKFKNCSLDIASYGIDLSIMNLVDDNIKFSVLPLIINPTENINTTELSSHNFLKFFEYLTLLHKNSPLISDQDNMEIDTLLVLNNSSEKRSNKIRFHIHNIISSFIYQILKKKWHSLSILISKSYFIIYRNYKDGMIIIYESK